jgi:hypothetical protein
MNISADRVCLITKDQAKCFFYLSKIFLRIDANQRAGWTILFAGVGRPFRSRGIQRSAFA